MPYTTLVAGTTITAAWANSNVRDQTIVPFASAAARASAITSPIEGQYTHLTDTNRGYHYNGVEWVPAVNGLVARHILTSNSSTFTTSATTDFLLSNVAVQVNRVYAIHLSSLVTRSAAGDWQINVHLNGALLNEIGRVGDNALGTNKFDMVVLWLPAVSGTTDDLDIRVVEISGTADLTFQAGASAARAFWLEDIGPV